MSRKLNLVVAAALGLAVMAPVQAQKSKAEKAAAEKAEKDPQAGGGLYKCRDADGQVTYTNVGSIKGCTKVEGEINSISMARPSAPASSPRPTARVEGGTARAGDRRRILQEELDSEQKRLADLKKEYNNGEPERQGGERNYQKYLDRTEQLKADVSRSEANVDSLRRELGNLKD